MKIISLIISSLCILSVIADVHDDPDLFSTSLLARGKKGGQKGDSGRNGRNAPMRDGLYEYKPRRKSTDDLEAELRRMDDELSHQQDWSESYKRSREPSPSDTKQSLYIHDDDLSVNEATVYYGSTPHQRVSDHIRWRHAAYPEEKGRLYVPHGDPKWKQKRRNHALRGIEKDLVLVRDEKDYASAHPHRGQMQTVMHDGPTSQDLEGKIWGDAVKDVSEGYRAQKKAGLPKVGGIRHIPIAPDRVEDLRLEVGPDIREIYPKAQLPRYTLPKPAPEFGYYPGGPASMEKMAPGQRRKKIPDWLRDDPEYGVTKFPASGLSSDDEGEAVVVTVRPRKLPPGTIAGDYISGSGRYSSSGRRGGGSSHRRRGGVGDLVNQQTSAANTAPTSGNDSSAIDATQDAQDFIDLWHECQYNASEIVWPIVLDMVDGSNSGLVNLAAWSLYLELSGFSVSTMGAFSRGGLSSIGWDEDVLDNNTSIPDDIRDQADAVNWLLYDAYNIAYLNATAALNASGLSTTMELLRNFFIRENATFTDDMLSRDENDPLYMSEFFLSYDQVNVDLGNLTVAYMNGTGGSNTTDTSNSKVPKAMGNNSVSITDRSVPAGHSV